MKRVIFIFLFCSCILINAGVVSAEITNPYTLDEKAQVVFGDSTTIEDGQTYYGLENYVTEYVDGYLHMMFTYTHVALDTSCCFASYPPFLHVTAVDPQGTTTPIIRDSQAVYVLRQKPIPPGHATDWYLYDVQFDSTGYTVVVKRAGVTEVTNFHRTISELIDTDWVALANRAPRNTPVLNDSMSFAPLPIYQAQEEPAVTIATTTPVIIVPGISSSTLIKDNNSNLEVWLNVPQMLISINDSYLDELSLSITGESNNQIDISADKIIKSAGSNDFFSSLFSKLGLNGYTENESLYEFPYDWRLDIRSSADKLKERIDEIKVERGVDKVDLVAHSMGGLVIKKYLKDYGGESVKRFIDIGTPHIGAPKAFKILNYGDNFDASFLFGLFGLNVEKVKEISQNMPSVYQLLPSQKYFDSAGYYVWSGSGENNRLSFLETQSYLVAGGRNSALVERADALHQELDGFNTADYGVETYNIVGCGVPTIGQFYILDDDEDHPIYNIRMTNGDGTVPLVSAEAMVASSTYYVRGVQHAVLPSSTGVKELVSSLLSTSTPFDISPYTNLSMSSSGCAIPDGRMVSFHSPIELHIYDSSGHHVGPDENGDIENEIEGLIYEEIGDNKFAFLPSGVEYSVRGEATGSGSFDVRIQEISGGEVVGTTVFADIPLTAVTQVRFALGDALPTYVDVDADDDGTYEYSYDVSTYATGILESTGKIVPVEDSLNSVEVGSSVAPVSIELVQTFEEKLDNLQVVSADVTSKIRSDMARVNMVDEQVNHVVVEAEYRTTAVALKATGYKLLINVLKMWLWMVNKL